jgi:hypothetical protein
VDAHGGGWLQDWETEMMTHKVICDAPPMALIFRVYQLRVWKEWALLGFSWERRIEPSGETKYHLELEYEKSPSIPIHNSAGEFFFSFEREKAAAADRLEMIKLGLVPASILRGESK